MEPHLPADLATPWCVHTVATMRIAEHVNAGVTGIEDLARQLLDAPAFLRLDGIGGRMAHAWSTLPDYVRTGRPAYAERFGLPFWDDLAADFDALLGPGGHGAPSPWFDLADGWDGVRWVVDVGGGTGVIGQSFFDPLPAGADAILRRCAEAGPRVVVIGGVAPDEAPRRLEIEMLLVGGRTDTLAEFRARAARCGLEVVAAGPQPAGRYVVECRRC